MSGVIPPVHFIPEDWDVVERKLEKIKVMLEKPLMAEIIEAGIMIVNTVKILISVAYPPPSLPGEPPRMRTGQLQESYDILEIGDYYVDVGTDLDYAFYLEFGCFTSKNSKILTQRGYVPFSDIREGELVLTHKNRWRKIIKKHIFETDQPIKRVTLTTQRGSKITVTTNHKFLTEGGFIEAERLNVGDRILSIHNDLPHFHWKNFMQCNPLKGRRVALYYEQECSWCNKKFEVVQSRVKFHKPNDKWYCSILCVNASRVGNQRNKGKHWKLTEEQRAKKRGQNNPMFDKKRSHYYSEIGYREDLGHKVKSTWEANYARILKTQYIQYDYEPFTFNLSVGTYTPDFFIYDPVGGWRFVEIKGYMTESWIKKFQEVRDRYPDTIIELIDESKYKELESIWKDKISLWESTKSVSRRGSDVKFLWDVIISKTTPCINLKKCYDLTVEEDESYILENLVCHNTATMQPRPHFFGTAMEVIKDFPKLFLTKVIDEVDSTG